MNTPSSSAGTADAAGSVTFVVQHRVRRDGFARYEDWLKKIVAVCSAYPGYQGVHIIRPVAGDNEYSTVVRFATFAEAERWCKSDDRHRLLAEIADILEQDGSTRIQTGIDFWFTPAAPHLPQARRWKQWLVTTAVIWPLTLLVPFLLEPAFTIVPGLGMPVVREAIGTAVIVALVVFLIMPPVARALAGWLYGERRHAAGKTGS